MPHSLKTILISLATTFVAVAIITRVPQLKAIAFPPTAS